MRCVTALYRPLFISGIIINEIIFSFFCRNNFIFPPVCAADGASFQVQEDGVAQTVVQAETQGRGGLFQDDASLQHSQVGNTSV